MFKFLYYNDPKENIFILKEKMPNFFKSFLFLLSSLIFSIFIFMYMYKIEKHIVVYGQIVEHSNKIYGELYIPKNMEMWDLDLDQQIIILILKLKKYTKDKLVYIPIVAELKKISGNHKIFVEFDKNKKEYVQFNRGQIFKVSLALGKESLFDSIIKRIIVKENK